MDQIKEIALTACTALIIGEIIYFLTPKDKITNCIYALVYTVAIISGILSFSKVDLDFSTIQPNDLYKEEINTYINDIYELETEAKLKEKISETLLSVHIECSSIDLILTISDENVLSIERVNIILKHKEDIENANIIVGELLNNEIPVEVASEK